jgi:hypothetical protein
MSLRRRRICVSAQIVAEAVTQAERRHSKSHRLRVKKSAGI